MTTQQFEIQAENLDRQIVKINSKQTEFGEEHKITYKAIIGRDEKGNADTFSLEQTRTHLGTFEEIINKFERNEF